MKFQGVSLILIFVWCIFMGITAISIGFGSLFPSMNLIAAPFVCPGGQMALTTQDYQVSPVESGTILNWYCVDGRSDTRTELNPFVINLYAGPIYGLALFVVVLILMYLNSKFDPSKEGPEAQKREELIKNIVGTAIIIAVMIFSLLPFFRSSTTPQIPTVVPNSTATSIALTFNQMSSGTPIAFNSTEKPLANWNDIPVMPQAEAGQQVENDRYVFKVEVDSGTIESFYDDKMPSLGWTLVDHTWLGKEFTKDNRTLLVTYAPASDLQSWIVTFVLI